METQTKSIEEQNKMIAEFMAGHEVETHHNQYHTSWNELMAVVDKIEGMVFPNDVYYTFSISGNYVTIISSGMEEFGSYAEETKLKTVYTAVVEFIEWYNENK